MDLERIADGADRFAAYVEELTGVIGHADRAAPLRDYRTGLVAAAGRRSVEPKAAVTAPGRVSVQHQKLLHFGGEGKSPIVMPACRSPISSVCRRTGPKMRRAATRPMFPRRSDSGPSRKSRWRRSAPRWRRASRPASC